MNFLDLYNYQIIPLTNILFIVVVKNPEIELEVPEFLGLLTNAMTNLDYLFFLVYKKL